MNNIADYCAALARAEADTPAPLGGLADEPWNLPRAEWFAAWSARDLRCAEELEAAGMHALAKPYRRAALRRSVRGQPAGDLGAKRERKAAARLQVVEDWKCVPRPRGDEPFEGVPIAERNPCSPPARG